MPAAKDGGKKSQRRGKRSVKTQGFGELPPKALGGAPAEPVARPRRSTSPAGDRPADRKRDLKRAEKFKGTSKYRRDVRETYAERPLAERRDAVKNLRGREGAAVRKLHGERERASSALEALARWQRKNAARKDFTDAPDIVRVGARIQGRRGDRLGELPAAVTRGDLSDLPKLVKGKAPGPLRASRLSIDTGRPADVPDRPRPEKDKPTEVKVAGVDLSPVANVVKAVAENFAKGVVVSPGSPATGMGQRFAARFSPSLQAGQEAQLRGSKDAATWALEQLMRPSSAVGGLIEGAAPGGKSAWEGMKEGAVKNDPEVWDRLAKNAGLPAWSGLVMAIALDPTTYASLGFKTPAQAAALKVARAQARAIRPVAKLAAKGDAAAQVELRRMLASRGDEIKKATEGLDDVFRGVQVGVRNPFTGRVRSTGGKATARAGRVSAPMRDRAAATKAGRATNYVGTRLSPHVRPAGADRAGWRDLRALEKEHSATEHLIARRGRALGQRIVRVFDGDEKRVRAFVDRVEAGDLAGLPKAERQAADELIDFHAEVARSYERTTGKPIGMLDSLMLAPRDLDDAVQSVRRVLESVERSATRGAAGAREELARAQGRAEILSRNVDDLPGERAARKGEAYAGGGLGVERATATAREQDAVAKSARGLREHLGSARAATADDEQRIAGLLSTVLRSAPDNPQTRRAQGQVDRILRRLGEDRVVNYVPREWDDSLTAMFTRQGAKRFEAGGGEAQFELARHDRRRLAAIRAADPEAKWSDQLGLLEAKYGAVMGRRLGELQMHGAIRRRFGRAATEADRDAIRSGELRAFRADDEGRLLPVERVREIDGDMIVLPDYVAEHMATRWQAADRIPWDEFMRAFKAGNTILRPGFFATTFVGNFWQQFLRDLSPLEMAQSVGALRRIRAADRAAIGKDANRWRLQLRKIMPETTMIDGRAMHFDELFDEAAEFGAARTGAAIGDPTDVSLVREAARRIEGAPESRRLTRGLEWLGQLAEDMDDMTRFIIYRRARLDGMDPREATQFTIGRGGAMIDYTDLTAFERKVMKRIVPFYVYTARNLPIQVKRLIARPGKLANFEKVRQELADLSGLPADWHEGLVEVDQEKMPFPVPGVKGQAGHQMFLEPRLPVTDIARPLQVLQGADGAWRMLKSFAGTIGPGKLPIEVLANKRLDFDRPIKVEGYRPEAGAIQRLVQSLVGYDAPAQDARSGKEYTATPPVLDYVLRGVFGSPASLALNAGRTLPDPSGVNPGQRALASFAGGVGLRAPDPLLAVREKVSRDADKIRARQAAVRNLPARMGGGRGGPKDIAQQDRLDEVNYLLMEIKAKLGDRTAIDGLPRARKEALSRMLNPPLPPEYRAMQRKLDRALDVLP